MKKIRSFEDLEIYRLAENLGDQRIARIDRRIGSAFKCIYQFNWKTNDQ